MLTKIKASPFWYTRFSINGVRIQESTKTTIRHDAKLYEQKRRAQLWNSIMLDIPVKPVYSWGILKQQYCKVKKDHASFKHDMLRLKFIDNYFPDSLSLNEINREKIEFIAEQKEAEGVTGSTVNRVLSLLKTALKMARDDLEWIDKIPKIRFRKESAPRTRYIKPKELSDLLRELPVHLNQLSRFALATGQRVSNILALKWADIDFDTNTWLLKPENTKNNSFNSVPLNASALAVLSEISRDHGNVFTFQGSPIKKVSTAAWNKAKKRAGIEDLRFHDLRHSTASYLAMAGASLQEIGAILGHKTLEITKRYSHLSPTHIAAVSEKLSIEEL